MTGPEHDEDVETNDKDDIDLRDGGGWEANLANEPVDES